MKRSSTWLLKNSIVCLMSAPGNNIAGRIYFNEVTLNVTLQLMQMH